MNPANVLNAILFLLIALFALVVSTYLPIRVGAVMFAPSLPAVIGIALLARLEFRRALLGAVIIAFVFDLLYAVQFGQYMLAMALIAILFLFFTEFVFKQQSTVPFLVSGIISFFAFHLAISTIEYSVLRYVIGWGTGLSILLNVCIDAVFLAIVLAVTQRIHRSERELFYEQ
jgi:cell shape-determining protein MreD